MSSVTLRSKHGASAAPVDLTPSRCEWEGERRVDFANYTPESAEPPPIELRYATTVFPLEGDRKLHASSPLRFAYIDDSGTVEILGWNLKVDLEKASDLPRQIGRRFLELFSRAENDALGEQDEACFDHICKQIDYRRFCAERDLPRYMEALVVRKDPALIRYLGGANIRLDPKVAEKIALVDEGEYFGGLFTLDRKGQITDIQNVVFVPSPEEILAGDEPADYRLSPEEFPEVLRGLLPKGKVPIRRRVETKS